MQDETATEVERRQVPDLDSAKHQAVEEVYEPIAQEGEAVLTRSVLDLGLSGLIAGLDIGFGALAMAVVAGKLHAVFHLDVKQALFFGGFLYPLGFVLVIMGKSELFTENTLAPVAGLLMRNGTLGSLVKSWVLIFSTNIAGAVLFSVLVAHVDVVFTQYRAVYAAMGSDLVKVDFVQVLLAGVLAGWLVALIGWLVESTKGSIVHFFVIYAVAYLIIGLGLFHCVIGTIEVLTAMFAGAPITWADWLGKFLVPATIGNIIGGVFFVAALKGFQAALSKGTLSPGGND